MITVLTIILTILAHAAGIVGQILINLRTRQEELS